jgi:hypothetical protein
MRRIVIVAAALCCVAAPAQAMSVQEFLGKIDGLKAKGMMALISPDIGLLKGEMKQVTDAYRADLQAARAAGRAPHSCPPPKGKAKIGRDELIAEFRAIPPAQRGVSVKAAFYAMMKKRFPCRAG